MNVHLLHFADGHSSESNYQLARTISAFLIPILEEPETFLGFVDCPVVCKLRHEKTARILRTNFTIPRSYL
jgi:hypothetical protein